jgi:hypothetical protein
MIQWDIYLTPNPDMNQNLSDSIRSPEKWKFPPSGFLKLNFDVASKGNTRPVGFGVVFRDD